MLKKEWNITDVTPSGNGRVRLIASYFLLPTGQFLKFKMSTFIQTGLMQEIIKKVAQFCLLAKRPKIRYDNVLFMWGTTLNLHVKYVSYVRELYKKNILVCNNCAKTYKLSDAGVRLGFCNVWWLNVLAFRRNRLPPSSELLNCFQWMLK
jgi:hypothetical protein